MKKARLILPLLAVILLSGCGQVKEHVHEYVESITKEPTCAEDGIRTFTCACGDTYDVTIPTVEHSFGRYEYHHNATHTTDGTETAVCKFCGKEDERTSKNSRFWNYSTDMEPTTMIVRREELIYLRCNEEGYDCVGCAEPGEEYTVTAYLEPGWYKLQFDYGDAYIYSDAMITRNASDFRIIDDLSLIDRYSDIKAWRDFWYENEKYELVVYTHKDTNVLLYNCVWTEEGKEYVPFFLFDDFDNFNYECVVEVDKLDSAIENDGFYYRYSSYEPTKYRSITDFQVY
ncbi:MAG: hypothetical protein J6Y09_09150 [Lachnospiraceae bacterium]|nr:hypothetical protein [Lachnospiraceae bacterium]